MADHDDPKPTDLVVADEEAEALARRVADLESELAAAKDEARQNHDRWVRERADLENVRKRATRDRQDAARYGIEGIARDLLPVVDNLERAVHAAGSGRDGGSVVEGVRLVLKTFADALARHGVERVSAKGEPFDPARHEAVAVVETDDAPPNHVVEEHQPGYRLHDRLLRPAMVSVAKPRSGRARNLANGEGGD